MLPGTKTLKPCKRLYNVLVASVSLEWWFEVCVCLCTIQDTIETAMGGVSCVSLSCVWFLQFSSNTQSRCCVDKALFQTDNSHIWWCICEGITCPHGQLSVWLLVCDPQHVRTLRDSMSCWCIQNKVFPLSLSWTASTQKQNWILFCFSNHFFSLHTTAFHTHKNEMFKKKTLNLSDKKCVYLIPHLSSGYFVQNSSLFHRGKPKTRRAALSMFNGSVDHWYKEVTVLQTIPGVRGRTRAAL